METNTFRRDLSGIYIFDKLPQDEKRKPTCIEDCNEDTRINWLNGLSMEALHNTAQHLNTVSDNLWNILTHEEQQYFCKIFGDVRYCEIITDKILQIVKINDCCKFLKRIADYTGICTPDSEAANN